VETYLTVDVPEFITTTLHVRRNPDKWGIVGFSELVFKPFLRVWD
jgi:hypothetical protein